MAYFVDAMTASGIPGEVHTTQQNDLGAVRRASDGNEYIYLAGAASVVDGEVVAYKPGAWTAVRLATGVKGCIAVATAAVVASRWGWFMLSGSDTVNTPSAIASNVPLYIGGVTGNIDDTAVKGDQILGAILTTAGSQDGTATISIRRGGATVGHNNESVG